MNIASFLKLVNHHFSPFWWYQRFWLISKEMIEIGFNSPVLWIYVEIHVIHVWYVYDILIILMISNIFQFFFPFLMKTNKMHINITNGTSETSFPRFPKNTIFKICSIFQLILNKNDQNGFQMFYFIVDNNLCVKCVR